MQAAELPAAFIMGVSVAFSGCLFPVLPTFVTYLAASRGRRGLLAGAACMLGIIASFTAYGVLASYVSHMLIAEYSRLATASGALLVLMGTVVLSPLKQIFYRLGWQPEAKEGVLGAFMIGLAFALIGAPCAGPVIISAVAMAASADLLNAALYMLSFSLGAGLPFLIVGGIAERKPVTAKLAKLSRYMEHVAGSTLVAVGAYMIAHAQGVI